MNEQEKKWFEALTNHRSEGAYWLKQPFLSGVQDSVVDKYSDQAHFIYELLQNADDVKATTATFRLEENGLYFTHNGSVHFAISDPQNEIEDKNNGTLGHINAITSIANSNKTETSIGNSIGKFGVGFKAVFQYTQTPHIYDPKIQFKIKRFIVPYRLDEDIDCRKSSETVFFFPFDHEIRRPQKCFDEILEKLKALEFPVLFLSCLNSVSFEAKNTTGKYTKEITQVIEKEDIKAQWIKLTLEVNNEKIIQDLLLFTRKNEKGYTYSIGYALGENGKPVPIDRTAFCFFPTKEVTNLNFIIHAPFLLTDSREGIKAGEDHNQELVKQLAQLAADSFPIIRDKKLIDDNLLEIIPYDQCKFSRLDDRTKISFRPFFDNIKHKLQTDTLLPAVNGEYSSKKFSYWASDTELVTLFADEQLAQLIDIDKAKWVFPSRGRKEMFNVNRALAEYIDGGDVRNRIEPNLIASNLDPEAVLKKIDAKFIATQPYSWLHKLYAYLSERESYQKFVKEKPIFIDQNGHAVSAFDANKQLILFLPDNEIDGYTTVHHELLLNEVTREFIEKFGIKKPSLPDEIYNKILPEYRTNEDIDTSPHFKKFFRYFKECPNDTVTEFIDLIKDKEFLLYTTAGEEDVFRGRGEDIYFPTDDLKSWFEPKPNTLFLSLDEYHKMVDEKDHIHLRDFFERLGVNNSPRVLSSKVSRLDILDQTSTKGNSHIYQDKYIEGCKEIIENINENRSILLWRVLSNAISIDALRGF